MPPTLDDTQPSDTLSSLLMCRHRARGCTYYARYQPGDEAWARACLHVHETVCWHRFDPPTIS